MLKHRSRVLVLAIASAVPTLNSLAQTSDTWAIDVGTAGGNWSSTSNWAHGSVPDSGGTAVFTLLPTFTTAPINIFQDVSGLSLGKLITETIITYQFGGQTLTLTGDATLDMRVPNISSLTGSSRGHIMQLAISGSSGLTKTGPGTLTLWSPDSTYTGGTRVNGGILVARQYGDLCFGDSAGSISMDGGTVRASDSNWTSSRTIQLNSGGGTLESTVGITTTLNGPVTGNGNLWKIGRGNLNLLASCDYSGQTQVITGSLILASNGALTNTSALVVRDALVLDNSTTSLPDRVNNSANVTLHGATLNFAGNSGSNTGETLGATTFSRGTSIVTVTASGQSAALVFGPVSRDTGGAVFFRGSSLGAAPGADVSNITFSSAPALVGGGGTTPTNVSIIPWAYGNTNASAALSAATNSFVTYSANGIRPLDVSTEYATSIAAAASTDNVRLVAVENIASPKTVNSLLISTSGGVSGSGTLSITSGALLNLNSGTSFSAPIDFGAAEGMIHAALGINLSGVISGTGGLNKQGAGAATLTAANTYQGTTTIGGGSALFVSSVVSGAPSQFGTSTSPIVLAPAGGVGNIARLVYSGSSAASFDRNLLITGRSAQSSTVLLAGFGLNNAQTLTMNGAIELDDAPLSLVGAAGSTLILNGNITGTGGPLVETLTTATSVLRFNGNNTFTGGAEMSVATWQIGSDSALGTGLLKLTHLGGAPVLQSVGGAHTVANAVAYTQLTSATYWQISGSQDITFTGSINLSGSIPSSSTGWYTHNITNTAVTTYAGVLHTGGFTKAGNGTLVLSGNNIYAGNTVVSSGVLRVTHGNALGSTAAPTLVATGAMLELSGNATSNEPVSLAGNGVASLGAICSSSGNNSLGNATLTANASIGVTAGVLSIGNIEAGALNFNKVGAGTLTANRVQAGAVSIDAGQLKISPGRSASKTSIATSLAIGGTASMDLGDNDLQVNYSGTSPVSAIQSYLQSGYNSGSWNGSGVISSVARVTPNAALGYSDSGSQVLVTYTLAGDADLDRKVNTIDFNQLAGNFGVTSGATWTSGDFNYDGAVDSVDFGLLSGAYGSVMPASSLGIVVPEPTTLGVLAFAGLMLRRPRN